MVCKPRTCDIDFPNRCMLKCRMCHFGENAQSVKPQEGLSKEKYREFLCELKSFVDEDFQISFGGGEPLLYSQNLFDIAEICKELSFKSYFPTNAFLLDEEMAHKIAQSGISSLGISLESLNKQTHDYIRGKDGCWDQVMKALDYLKKYCPQVSVNILTIIMGLNLDEIIDLAKWVCNNPYLEGIVFQAIQKPFGAHCSDDWYELDAYSGLWIKDISRGNTVIEELIKIKASDEGKNKISNSIVQLRLFQEYFRDPAGMKRISRCHMGDGVIRLDWNGDVVICGDMDRIGNITENGIKDIWYSQKADEVRNQIVECKKGCHNLINCFQDQTEGG